MLICKNRGGFWDLLFALGLIFTTMTSLRISSLPIGIGEILLVVWMLKQWVSALLTGSIEIEKLNKNILIFWLLFFIILGLGMMVSSSEGRLVLKGSMHDFMAYIFSFFLSVTLLLKNQKESIYNKIKFIVIAGTIIFTFLLIWWKNISPYFLGMSLVYGGVRFTGGAINPNQLALFIVPIPALSLFLLNNKMNKKAILGKTFLLFIFLASIYVGLNIQSDAVKGTFILMLTFFLMLSIYKKLRFPSNILLMNFVLILVFFIILLNTGMIESGYYKLFNWFEKLDSDGSRAFLWVQGIKTAFESPFVGYGPGSRIILSPVHSMETHNTFIDLLLQVGFIGLFLYIVILMNGLKTIKRNKYLIIAFLGLIIFSVSHFVLRQPIFWMYLILIYLVDSPKEKYS